MYDVGIIGSGPAGMAAALYLLRAGKRVVMFEKECIGGQLAKSPCIENYPGYMGSGEGLADSMFAQLSAYDNFTFRFEEVTAIQKSNDDFDIFGDGLTPVHRVIYAAGVTHKTLPCIKGEIDHVHYCATCDGAFYKNKMVAVIGDGNTALQYALELSKYCYKVVIITMFDKFFGEPILIDRVKNNPKIIWQSNVLINDIVQSEKSESLNLIGSNNFITSVDGVFIAIGQKANCIKLPPEVWNINGYIIANARQESNLQGFYAVGDCIEKEIRQVTLATAEGTRAALDIIKKDM